MKRWICLLFIKIFRLTVFTLEDATARGWSNKAIWVWYRRGVKVGWSEQMFTRGYVESAVTKVKAKAHLLAVKSVDSQDNSVLAYPSNGEVAGVLRPGYLNTFSTQRGTPIVNLLSRRKK